MGGTQRSERMDSMKDSAGRNTMKTQPLSNEYSGSQNPYNSATVKSSQPKKHGRTQSSSDTPIIVYEDPAEALNFSEEKWH